jgi:hypothetical protein
MKKAKEKDKLLVLDLNNVLVTKEYDPDEVICCDGPDAMRIHNMAVRKRAGVDLFMDIAMREYDVGIYSSTTEANAGPIVKWLLGSPTAVKKLKFVWYRDRCVMADEGHETYKLLQRVWDNPVVNGRRTYGPHNTLLVDDDAAKLERTEGLTLIAGKDEPLKDLQKRIAMVFNE